MKKFMISSVAVFAAFAFAGSVSAVSATEIYTPTSGYLKVGSGYGAKISQNANVIAAQKALNVCVPGMSLVLDGKFGPLTEGKFKTFQASKGIKVDGIIGPVTAAQLAACSGDTTTPSTGSTTLNGGAGDLDVSDTSTNVENSLKEGEEDVVVLGFKGEADGSDIAITSIKVSLEETGGLASEDAEDYIDEVSVWYNGKKVGSADMGDFSENNDVFTKTISTSGLVIEEDEEEKVYVAVSAKSSIDSDDINDGEWTVAVETIRYNDATGAILSANTLPTDKVFTFEDESTDDDLSIKSSSANPVATTLEVEEDAKSDDYMIGAFKFDVDEDSSEITLNDFDVVLTINDSADTASSDDADAIVDTVMVSVGGDEYEADLVSETITNGDGTATYNVELDGDVSISSGKDKEVKIYVTFNDQDLNYGAGTTVQASVNGADVDAEGADDLSASGSFTGKIHTLSVGVPTVTLSSTPTLKLSSAVDAGADVWVAEFKVKVTAPEDQDVYLPLDSFAFGTAGTSGVEYNLSGGSTILSAVLEANDSDIEEDDSYLVAEGTSEDFTFKVFIEAANASEKVTITSFWYETSDSVANGSPEITSGLTNFKTGSVFLAI